MINFVGSSGKEFIVIFMKNLERASKSIYFMSKNGAQLNITTSPRLDPSMKSKIDRKWNTLSSGRIFFPTEIELTYFQKEVKSVLIESSDYVSVISFDDAIYSVGSTTIIPIQKLSTKYVVISTEPVSGKKSQLAVTAIKNNTDISVTFKMKENLPLNIDGKIFYNGDVFYISLDYFETYQIAHLTDLTGTFIESSDPIAAFSGNDCNKLYGVGYCDHLIEQLPSIDNVDNTYIVPPNLDGRDTTIRITAMKNLSEIHYVIGAKTQSLSLDAFDTFNMRITSTQTCFIESSSPILVTGIGLRPTISNLGDPSMTIVPGIRQYLNYYKTVVPHGFVHSYVSVMIKYSSKDFIRVNGMIVNTCNIVYEENVLAGNETYSVRSIRVEEGEFTAFTLDGENFGLMFAGVKQDEAYGFSGNSVMP